MKRTIGIFFIHLLILIRAEARVFDQSVPLRMRLSAPLTELFQYRHSPEWPNHENKNKKVEGVLSAEDHNGQWFDYKVRIKLRGHSSQNLSECEFPKISLKFVDSHPRGSLFEGHKEIDFGTHCSKKGGYSPIGRLRDGKTPHREVLVYEILKILEIPSFRARAGWIDYYDTKLNKSLEEKEQVMILEDMSTLLEKYEARDVSESYVSLKASPGFTELDAARIYFFEALINNWDWRLQLRPSNDRLYQRFWNMKAIQKKDGQWMIFPYDFDLSGVVTVKSYHVPSIENQIKEFPLEIRQKVIEEIQSKEPQIFALLSRLENDPEGQKNFEARLRSFLKKVPGSFSRNGVP